MALILSICTAENVRTAACISDTDCPNGYQCDMSSSSPTTTTLGSLLALLLGGTKQSAGTCVMSEQSASEFTMLKSDDVRNAVACHPYDVNVPIGTSVGIPTSGKGNGFYTMNFAPNSLSITVRETQTGRELSDDQKFTFACDAHGNFTLHFVIQLRQGNSIIDDSHICAVSVACLDSNANEQVVSSVEVDEVEFNATTGNLTVGNLTPKVECYESPITLNTDRSVSLSLENVAYAVQLLDMDTNETVRNMAKDIVTDVQLVSVNQKNEIQMSAGPQLSFQCTTPGKHYINILVSAFHKPTGNHVLDVCVGQISCNTSSLTAKLVSNTTQAESNVTTGTSTDTEATTTTINIDKEIDSTTSSTDSTFIKSFSNSSALFQQAQQMFHDVVRSTFFEKVIESEISEADTDTLEKIFYNSH